MKKFNEWWFENWIWAAPVTIIGWFVLGWAISVVENCPLTYAYAILFLCTASLTITYFVWNFMDK